MPNNDGWALGFEILWYQLSAIALEPGRALLLPLWRVRMGPCLTGAFLYTRQDNFEIEGRECCHI